MNKEMRKVNEYLKGWALCTSLPKVEEWSLEGKTLVLRLADGTVDTVQMKQIRKGVELS